MMTSVGTHKHVPHESPASMWVPLASWRCLRPLLVRRRRSCLQFISGSEHPGGRMNIVNFLDPIIWNSATGEFGRAHASETTEHGSEPVAAAPAGETGTTEHATASLATESTSHAATAETGFNLAHAAESALGSHTASEWLFIVISIVVAGSHWLVGCSTSRIRNFRCLGSPAQRFMRRATTNIG